jgi:hypothetical protein
MHRSKVKLNEHMCIYIYIYIYITGYVASTYFEKRARNTTALFFALTGTQTVVKINCFSSLDTVLTESLANSGNVGKFRSTKLRNQRTYIMLFIFKSEKMKWQNKIQQSNSVSNFKFLYLAN